MNITKKVLLRLVNENIQNGSMFWIYPIERNGTVGWDIMILDSTDPKQCWPIVRYKMQQEWDKNLDACSDYCCCLPRGIIADDVIYHGNNLPDPIRLKAIAKQCRLQKFNSVYDKTHGINNDDLNQLENCLGCSLNLLTTD